MDELRHRMEPPLTEIAPDRTDERQAAQPLVCLAYLSSATRLMDREALTELVEHSARNNAARQITGMLCYHDGSFLQFLEGPAEEVDTLLAVIARDRRHIDLIEMYRKPIAARTFADWSMALRSGEELGEAQRDRLRSLRRFAWGDTSEAAHRPVLQDLLDTFRAWIR
jgi:hypothetical protein